MSVVKTNPECLRIKATYYAMYAVVDVMFIVFMTVFYLLSDEHKIKDTQLFYILGFILLSMHLVYNIGQLVAFNMRHRETLNGYTPPISSESPPPERGTNDSL